MKRRQSHLSFDIIKISLVILLLLFYSFLFKSAYAQIPANGLVAYWTFNEGSGTTAQDSTGNNNTGTLINGPSWVSGRSGNALSFDGSDDYVEINDSNALDLTGGEFTLSAWIYPESYGEALNGRIIDHGGGSNGDGGWSLLVNNYQNGLNLRLSIRDENIGNTVFSDVGSISLNTWQYVAVTLKSSSVTFYINGQMAGQTAYVPAPTDRTAPVRIGMRATDFLRAFNGVIDEVRVHNRALSSQEVADLYNLTPPLSDMVPPAISNGQPSGLLPLDTTTATLSVTTDEAATCKYSLLPGTPYSSMPDTFANTGGMTHAVHLSGLEYIQSGTYYVKCRDQSGNSNPADYPVSFSFNRTVYSVSMAGSDSNPGTEALPFKTIQHAIGSAGGNNPYETIIKVAKGTYYENLNIVCCTTVNKWRLLGGWNSNFSQRDEAPSRTVIDGGGRQRVIRINVPALDITIDGFTIRNGFSASIGGGIAVFPFYHGTMTLTLVNNIIARNTSGSAGGGVYVVSKEYASTTLTLIDNVLAHNSADDLCGGVCVISESHADTSVTLTGNTVIDNRAGNEGGGIYIRSYSGATTSSAFTNNTITHNSAAYFGGGIYLYAESDAVLTADLAYNRITDNGAPYAGGGVYVHSASNATLKTSFTDNTITGNSAAIHGGGIYSLSDPGASITSSGDDHILFKNNTITGNSAGYDGGGVFCWGTGMTPSTPLIFVNNIIAGNSAYHGGGVFATEGTTLQFTNNTITDNRAAYSGGGMYGGLWFSGSDALTTVDIINTIVFGNTTTRNGNDDVYIESYQSPDFTRADISYSDVGIMSGNYENLGNNMNMDPLFRDSANMDYHLASSSPLINKGNNAAPPGVDFDLEGDPRIMHGKVDIGADEHVFSIIKPETVPTMTIDGDLSEYEGADSITLNPSAEGNSVSMRTLWNSEALFLAYAVSDTYLNASITVRDGQVKNEDSAGWMIDTLNDDGGSADPDSPFMLPDDYLGLVNILNTQYDSQGTSAGTPASSWNGSWQSAVQFSGTINNNTDADAGYKIEVKVPWSTLGFAGTPSADTPVRVGFLINDKDVSACDINPDGTYIDAENFTGTVIQGTGTFSVESSQAGYLGSGYLRSNGGGTGICPPVHQGKQYQVNFPSSGTYKVWIKGYCSDDSSDSLFIGLDGTCAGALTEDLLGQWSWTNTVNNGSNTINVTAPGTHTINIWVREPDHLLDGIYLTKGSETPSDASHGTEINPAACGASHSSIWPQGDAVGFQNASNWMEMRFAVLTPYYCDYDHDGYIASLPSNVCIGSGCQPIYCQTVPGTDCNDNDFYEHPDQIWYKDSDNDDYSDGINDRTSCTRPAGYKTDLELISASADCNDTNEFVYPWAPEIWYDGVDQNCDGWNDYDRDMDGFVHENWNPWAGGSSAGTDDCDDTNSAISPDSQWCPDVDADGYGDPAVCFVQCIQPDGYVLNNGDCDDNDANIYPGGLAVRISGAIPAYYSLIQEAYDAAGTGETIQCQNTEYREYLFFDLDKTISIEGGYDCAYSSIAGITTLYGNMIMTEGSVTVEDFELQIPSDDYYEY